MKINNNEIKYINVNITNKQTRSILTEKYFNFLGYDEEEDKIFFQFFVELLLNYKGNSRNIDITFFDNSIYINCYYTKMFSKTGDYTNIIKNYIKLIEKISIEYDNYVENNNFWHEQKEEKATGAPA